MSRHRPPYAAAGKTEQGWGDGPESRRSLFQISLAAFEDVTGVLVTNGATVLALVAASLSTDECVLVLNNLVGSLPVRDVA